jgi:hypothetical protein
MTRPIGSECKHGQSPSALTWPKPLGLVFEADFLVRSPRLPFSRTHHHAGPQLPDEAWLSRIISRSCERDNYDDLPSIGRPSEYPSDDFIGICIKTAAMAQQDSLRLP